jgi:hypothetical protein
LTVAESAEQCWLTINRIRCVRVDDGIENYLIDGLRLTKQDIQKLRRRLLE